MKTNYVFVMGGVASSLGKGIATASLAALLQARGLKVTVIKLDPYINLDPGTINPTQHGEIFVTHDGAETDLDLGHYERFTRTRMSKLNNFTAGSVYFETIQKEREGHYLGNTIQIIPHITDTIKRRILKASINYDVALIEVGGTVGDIESLPFLEAVRQMAVEAGRNRFIHINLVLVPYLASVAEIKTKPAQHSVQKLLSIGIQPDIILCRATKKVPKFEREKISLFCNVLKNQVLSIQDVKSIYEIPRLLQRQSLDDIILKNFGYLRQKEANLSSWEKILKEESNIQDKITVGIVGKYVDLPDSYKSIIEALKHGGMKSNLAVQIKLINAENINYNSVEKNLLNLHAILIPGGFGLRGIQGKIISTQYARKNKIPFLGICLGLQIAVIEYAKNVVNIKGANSTEFDPSCLSPVISIAQHNQQDKKNMGGTMRLGAQECWLKKDTLIHSIYKKQVILERHRHRYEVNNIFKKQIESAGMYFTSQSVDNLAEVIEIPKHPWFLGCQFHPEFTSNPHTGHPLFIAFVKAAYRYKLTQNNLSQ